MSKVPDLVKFNKFSKTLLKLVSAGFWIVFVLTIVFIVTGIAVRFVPENIIVRAFGSGGTFGLSPDNIIQFDIAIESISNSDLISISSSFLIGISLSLLLATIVLRQLRFVMINVAASKPFHEKNSIRIKNIGCAVIAGSIIIPISKAYMMSKIMDTFELANVSVVYSINVEIMFIGILLLLLSAIFQYGAYLQQEYDTTL